MDYIGDVKETEEEGSIEGDIFKAKGQLIDIWSQIQICWLLPEWKLLPLLEVDETRFTSVKIDGTNNKNESK